MRQCGTLDAPLSHAMIRANHYGATMNKNSASRAGDIRVAVIGAGMSGILTGIRLLQAGIHNFVIYEKADRLGGTWRENTYPGLSCDVPSHHYVYSFEPNPEWSYMFSPGAEIHGYFEVACKRLIMSDIFYGAIQQANAHLVTEGIERIEPHGVRTKDGVLHELDVLVLASGLDGHRFMRDVDITGQDGLRLNDAWQQSLQAYRCLAVPKFPNFFMLIGPNSPIGNFSLILIAEMQVDYILKLIARIRDQARRALAPTVAATRAFNADIREAMKHTEWVSGCRSWYLDKNGTPVTWPWSFERFIDDMRAPKLAEFEMRI